MAETPPAGIELVRVVLDRFREYHYNGHWDGTCYECPFASVPLEKSGEPALWGDISNDPTEAYFRCSLPGRDSSVVAWGEEAPCKREEWADAALQVVVGQLEHEVN